MPLAMRRRVCVTATCGTGTARPPPAPAGRHGTRTAGGRREARASPRTDSQAAHDWAEAGVERIGKLRQAGNDEDADREVARLKQRYPDFAMPREALRATGTR